MIESRKYRFFIYAAFFIWLSCNPSRQADRLVDKAMRLDPTTVVKKVTPSIVTQVRIVRDTIRQKEVIKIKEEIKRKGDSIRLIVPGDCDAMRRQLEDANLFIEGLQNVMNDLPILTDTIYMADTGRLWLAEYNNRFLIRDLDAEKGKRIRDLRMFLFLIILAIIGFIAYQFRRK